MLIGARIWCECAGYSQRAANRTYVLHKRRLRPAIMRAAINIRLFWSFAGA